MSSTTMSRQPEQNKMGTMPVNRLLISMSLPMIISMLVQALYNIIDSVFVAQISEAALAAVSMAFPVQSLMIAVSTGTCVGVNALLSRSLGEGKQEEARLAAVNGIFLAILGALAFLLFGLFGAHTYFSSQTSDPLIIEYGTQYLEICTVFSFGIFGEIILERILQSTGRTIYNMYSQGIGAIINIVLDPIMIFGLLGCPAMGISGAAAATVIGQIIAMFLALYFNLKKNHDVSINMRGFRPDMRIIRIIYSVGLPSIIMQSITSVMTYGMNLILISFSATAVTVLGIYFKLQSFIFMPIFGLNNGMIPIIAYNYGARSKKRIMDTAKLSIAIAISIMLLGLAVFQVFTPQLLMLFNASDNLLEMGIPALRTISLCFPAAALGISFSNFFQAIGEGKNSLLISVLRQLFILLPAAWLISRIGTLNQVWLAFPIAEVFALIVSILLLKLTYKSKIHDMEYLAAEEE